MLRSDGFMGNEGKVTMGGYTEKVIESRFSAACTGKMT